MSNSKQLDPSDDAPELDRNWFEQAEIRKGDKVIRPARPAKKLEKKD